MKEFYFKDKENNRAIRGIGPKNDINCAPLDYFKYGHAEIASNLFSDVLKVKSPMPIPDNMVRGFVLQETDKMIEEQLKKKYKCLVTIHMDPVAVNDEKAMAIKAQVSEIVKKIDERMSIHDFRMTDGIDRDNLIFDVVVPFGLKMTDAEVRENVSVAVSALDPHYFCVINIDKDYA
jgi:hypothetical protein